MAAFSLSHVPFLDERPMVVRAAALPSPALRVVGSTCDTYCCLLCARRFESIQEVAAHINMSVPHAERLAAAVANGRISEALVPRPNSNEPRSAAGSSVDAATTSKRPRDGEESPAPSLPAHTATTGLSALEQTELLEKRLKVEAVEAAAPAGAHASASCDTDQQRVINSSVKHARSINKQMDWECSGCGHHNFAKYIVCTRCNRRVDASTKYITNRLQELKNERFPRLRQRSRNCRRSPPWLPPPSAPTRPVAGSARMDRPFSRRRTIALLFSNIRPLRSKAQRDSGVVVVRRN